MGEAGKQEGEAAPEPSEGAPAAVGEQKEGGDAATSDISDSELARMPNPPMPRSRECGLEGPAAADIFKEASAA